MKLIWVDLGGGGFSALASDTPVARKIYFPRENECCFLPLRPSITSLEDLRTWNTNTALSQAEEAEAQCLATATERQTKECREAEARPAEQRKHDELAAESEAQEADKQRRAVERKRRKLD